MDRFTIKIFGETFGVSKGAGSLSMWDTKAPQGSCEVVVIMPAEKYNTPFASLYYCVIMPGAVTTFHLSATEALWHGMRLLTGKEPDGWLAVSTDEDSWPGVRELYDTAYYMSKENNGHVI